MKRKKQCIIGGFLYLIGGLLLWMGKIIYFIILIIQKTKGNFDFEDSYENIYMLVFALNILTIFFRLGVTFLVKQMYKHVCTLEEYIHEKDHAKFIQSLSQNNPTEDKLVDDEEVTEVSA